MPTYCDVNAPSIFFFVSSFSLFAAGTQFQLPTVTAVSAVQPCELSHSRDSHLTSTLLMLRPGVLFVALEACVNLLRVATFFGFCLTTSLPRWLAAAL